MAKTINVELTSKEAMELLASQAVSARLVKKVVAALRVNQPYPKGWVAAAVANTIPAKASPTSATSKAV